MGYITVKGASEQWNMSVRSIQALCKQGRIEGARKSNNLWQIPEDAQRPADGRLISGKYVNWRQKYGKITDMPKKEKQSS